MEIREAQEARSDLEGLILEHIAKFEQETGLHVTSVNLTPTQSIDDRLPHTVSLQIQTQL